MGPPAQAASTRRAVQDGYSGAELSAWDQRETLQPPPYRFGAKRLLGGLGVGDELFDTLPLSRLACHGKSAEGVPQLPEPEWVDWERLARGQALWNLHLSRSFAALALSLLSGFAIARFGEVLLLNGYAQDGHTAMQRYQETGFAITDWFRFDIRDPGSLARRSLYTVRAMHAFARRRSQSLFDRSRGEGVALSQYDMAEVLLGFSGICMSVIENELGFGPIPEPESEDMCFYWRYLGYHLGILDEYNPCVSLGDLRAVTADYMAWTPRRFETARPSCAELRRTAIEGFAMQTGLGENFWYAAFNIIFDTDRIDLRHTRPPQKFLPGVDVVAKLSMRLFAHAPIAAAAGAFLIDARDTKRDRPDKYHRRASLMLWSSKLHDKLIWRVVSAVYYARYIVAAFFLARILKAALPRVRALRKAIAA
jgi:hypothetical protein